MYKTQSDIAIKLSGLEANPIAIAIKEKMKEMLYDDLSKSDIREAIKEAHPGFPDHLFEECFTEAFTTL
jgi:hypothetical protein